MSEVGREQGGIRRFHYQTLGEPNHADDAIALCSERNTMKTESKLAFATVLAGVAIFGLFAADQPKAKDVQRREMAKLDWLVGRWKGSGNRG